jgi:hypothetical protein
MYAAFSVVNFEYPAWYCRTVELYVLSSMPRGGGGASKWRGMATRVLNNRLPVMQVLVVEKKPVTNSMLSVLLTKAPFVVALH